MLSWNPLARQPNIAIATLAKAQMPPKMIPSTTFIADVPPKRQPNITPAPIPPRTPPIILKPGATPLRVLPSSTLRLVAAAGANINVNNQTQAIRRVGVTVDIGSGIKLG